MSTTTTPITTTPRTPISYSDPVNSLTRPEGDGPENQLVLGEGVYVLRDIITLGAVPPPPAETTGAAVNVLDTKPPPETAPPRLSVANLLDHTSSVPANDIFSSAADKQFGEDVVSKKPVTVNGTSRLTHLASGNLKGYVRGGAGPGAAPPKPQNNRDSKELVKRRKPKASLMKSNSSMIARASPHEALSKRIQEHKPEGYFAFVNNSRAFMWLDISSSTKAQQLIKIMFSRAHALCHDVNVATKSPTHLDVVMGFSTADIIWYEPMSQKYSHLNKHGVIHALPISGIHWLPGSENLFLAAHLDGTLIIYDKEKEDAPFIPEDGTESRPPLPEDEKRRPQLEVKRSLKAPSLKNNPVAVYKVTRQRVNAIEFSPDGRFLVVVSEDGSLRILDLMKEELIDLYSSYYGGINCICWSPDGKYIVTGGQDDIVSIWSFEDRVLVARCLGHRSWVSAIAFDRWRCDETNYRFGSVGEDRRLLLWDFSTGLVQRPRAASIRPSVVSYPRAESAMASRTSLKRSLESLHIARSGDDEGDSLIHPIEFRSQVSTLPPVFSKQVDEHPLTWLGFFEDSIIICCSMGHINTYDRPKAEEQSEDGSADSGFSNPFKS